MRFVLIHLYYYYCCYYYYYYSITTTTTSTTTTTTTATTTATTENFNGSPQPQRTTAVSAPRAVPRLATHIVLSFGVM